MEPLAHIFLLGRLYTSVGGSVTSRFYSQKAELLLAKLSLSPGRAFGRDELTEWLWPDSEPAAGRTNLRSVLTSLRHVLEPEGSTPGSVLHADRQRIRFVAGAVNTDVASFEKQLPAAVQATDKREKEDLLRQAVGFYQGEFLPGHYNDWVLTERERLAALYCQSLRMQIRLWERDGDLVAAVEAAQRLAQEQPFDETTLRLLLNLLFEDGRGEQARQHYERFRHRLKTELGSEPELLTSSLVTRFSSPADPARKVTPTRSAAMGTHHSPAAQTSKFPLPYSTGRFVGREDEIIRLKTLLNESRSVLLTGMGGVGKTRLALEALRRLPDEKPALYVCLPEGIDVEQVPGAIRNVLDLPPNPRKTAFDQLCSFLADRPLLLTLDNCEMLARESSASLITRLLERLPRLHFLLISRQVIRVQEGETLELRPLAFPSPGAEETQEETLASPSIALFVDRIRSRWEAFELTPHTLCAIVRLCARLEGSPLALELAAARCGVMTPAQIESALSDQFRLLVSRNTPADSRHASLFATIAWSEKHLTKDARHFLAGLSVFRGDFSLEASLSLDMGASELIEELSDASLIHLERAGGAIRFRLPDALREFAALRRQEEDAHNQAGRRILDYFLTYAEGQLSRLDGPEIKLALDALQGEEENLRAVLLLCLETADLVEKGLRLCNALRKFWFLRARLQEGMQWLTSFLKESKAGGTEVATAHLGLGTLAWGQSDWRTASEHLQLALRLYREQEDRAGQAGCLLALAQTQHGQGDYAGATDLAEESLSLFRSEKDALGEANALHTLANNRLALGGEESEVRPLYDRCIALYRRINNPSLLGAALTHLGVFYLGSCRLSTAKRLHEEAIKLLRDADNRRSLAYALNSYGSVLRELDNREASAAYQESLRLFREMGERQGMASVLGYLGMLDAAEAPLRAQEWLRESLLLWQETELSFKPGVLVTLYAMAFVRYRTGDRDTAACLFGAADANYHSLREETGNTMVEERQFIQWQDDARRSIPPESWFSFYEEGTRMDWATTVAFALA